MREMKHFKVITMATALLLGSLGAASASDFKYDPSMPKAAVAQHEQIVRDLQRQAARKAKHDQALQAQASANDRDETAKAATMLGFIALVAVVAAL
jgi:hypothetical protein